LAYVIHAPERMRSRESAVGHLAAEGMCGVTLSMPSILGREGVVRILEPEMSRFTRGATVSAGGLIGYGIDLTGSYRQSGSYIGRILQGAKPGELPVLPPTKVFVSHKPQD
jgi:hypothetical protein